MATQATYRLFAGLTRTDFGLLVPDDIEWRLLDALLVSDLNSILNSEGNLNEDELAFRHFCFNEEFCAIGVQVQELDWNTEITEGNKYDPVVAERAQKTLAAVNAVFQEQGIPLTAKLYHYLDLG